MQQQAGEKTQFFTRVRAAVLDCNFIAEDPMTKVQVDYTEKIVSLILLQCLPDNDIRREILRKKDIDDWDPQKIV